MSQVARLQRRGVMSTRAMVMVLALLASSANAATAVLFQSAPGRFEIAATDAEAARPVLSAAQSLWSALSGPLDLPEAFSSPVFVRVVPAVAWREVEPFHVTVEAAGLVTLRIRGGNTPEEFVRRGLVQALLMRLAVAEHGVSEKLAAPLWLEIGCVEWWRGSEAESELDRLKRTSAPLAPAPLAEILGWQRGAPEPIERVVGAYWLLRTVRAESGQGGEWRRFRTAMLGGVEAEQALAASFPESFSSDAERELWWLTGWHHFRRERSLPLLDAAESRATIADALRIVCRRDGEEAVIAPEEWSEFGRRAFGRAVLAQRAALLSRTTPALHPFYRNAGISLERLLRAAVGGDAEAVAQAQAQFEADWRDASELEVESARALDELERGRQ